jgi:hypothetical protein
LYGSLDPSGIRVIIRIQRLDRQSPTNFHLRYSANWENENEKPDSQFHSSILSTQNGAHQKGAHIKPHHCWRAA